MNALELKKVLGRNTRFLRKAKGLTQAEFAKVMKRTPGSISRFENGKQIMGVDLLIQIANYFDVSVDELIRPEGTAAHLNSIISMLAKHPDESLASLKPYIHLWA